jgi:hypothetical protein
MTAVARITENPFLVLGLPPTATRMEIEREAQKLLGMLELGLAAAATYDTPLGPRPRTPDLVRAAAATLRDPARRLAAELWASASPPSPQPRRGEATTDQPVGPAPWPDALARLGWRRP